MKSRALLYHILFWAGIYGLWVLIFRSYSIALTKTMTIEFCYLLFITIDFYIIHYFTLPRLLRKKRYSVFVLSILAVILVSAGLRSLVAMQMNARYFHTLPAPGFDTLLINSVINIALWVLAVTIGKMLIDQVATQKKLEALEKERTKNELDYLKAQMNPHALFNSLNTIYGNIPKENQQARNILLQFSELLRYQLYDCSAERVSLAKELEYIRNYVAIQRLRKEGNLAVCLEIENDPGGLEIAPLMLGVLIENAFKHVSSDNGRENRIGIRLSAGDRVLQCVVANTKEPQQRNGETYSGGIGLANLKRRLELLYPGRHHLDVRNEHDYYETHLTIQLA